MTEKPCYLCLRVTPKQVFHYAHLIWTDKTVAHRVGVIACRAIELSYKKDPTKWCNKTRDAILGSLFYAIGLKLGVKETEHRIWNILKGYDEDGYDAKGKFHWNQAVKIGAYYRGWFDVLADL